jgi:hypothetical protein
LTPRLTAAIGENTQRLQAEGVADFARAFLRRHSARKPSLDKVGVVFY